MASGVGKEARKGMRTGACGEVGTGRAQEEEGGERRGRATCIVAEGVLQITRQTQSAANRTSSMLPYSHLLGT